MKIECIISVEKKTIKAWELMKKIQGELPSRENEVKMWKKPVGSTVKVNMDGAVTESFGEAGVGCAIRDHQE